MNVRNNSDNGRNLNGESVSLLTMFLMDVHLLNSLLVIHVTDLMNSVYHCYSIYIYKEIVTLTLEDLIYIVMYFKNNNNLIVSCIK